jgi:hypothetical protein
MTIQRPLTRRRRSIIPYNIMEKATVKARLGIIDWGFERARDIIEQKNNPNHDLNSTPLDYKIRKKLLLKELRLIIPHRNPKLKYTADNVRSGVKKLFRKNGIR